MCSKESLHGHTGACGQPGASLTLSSCRCRERSASVASRSLIGKKREAHKTTHERYTGGMLACFVAMDEAICMRGLFGSDQEVYSKAKNF